MPRKIKVEKLNKKTLEREEMEKKEMSYNMTLQMATKKNQYIRSIINGRYFFARANMLATQIIEKDIKEKLDGHTKTEEYMRAEYAMQKMQAIICFRDAHFAKKDLIETFKLSAEQIEELEKDYYDGKIIREDYDESYKKGGKAEFVNS